MEEGDIYQQPSELRGRVLVVNAMLVGPLKPPQFSKVPGIKNDEDSDANIDDETLQTLLLPRSNCMVVLTTKQILIYNCKPMALVASSKRSAQSLIDFGKNKYARADGADAELFKDVLPEQDLANVNLNQRKLIFYVISEKNYIFVFQILLSTSPLDIFKETGIPIIGVRENVDQDYGQELMDNNEESDCLTVFDKVSSHKVIQNGFAVEKQQGFLHFLTRSPETMDELPIKKVELRLKIILKFEHDILDVTGLCESGTGGDKRPKEHLMILFPHGLQVLGLESFKLKNNSLVDISCGRKLLNYRGTLHVISQTSDAIIMNQLDFAKKAIQASNLELKSSGTLINAFIQLGSLILVFDTEVVWYDITNSRVFKRMDTLPQITISGPLTSGTSLILTTKGISMLTSTGNCLFSTLDDDSNDLNDFELFSSFSCLGGSLVTTSANGNLAKWDLWTEISTLSSDMRNPTRLLLKNDYNDIMLFSPASGSASALPFQIVKLPTQTINNCISLAKTNGCVTLVACFVSNKKILLLHDLVSNEWHSFSDMAIIEMAWFCNEFLLCHTIDEEKNEQLKCYHLSPQKGISTELNEQLIWEHPVPTSMKLESFHVTTLAKYRPLKVTPNKNTGENVENMFKVAEIILQYNQTDIRIIDVISQIHADGSMDIKAFHQFPARKLNNSFRGVCDWIFSHNGGLLSYCNGSILKWEKSETQDWHSTVLLDNTERILDLFETKIYLIREKSVLVYSIEDLWNGKDAIASIDISDSDYPVSVSPETAIVHSIQFVFSKDSCKLIPHQAIYLDQVVDHYLSAGYPIAEIDAIHRNMDHYKFTLEKLLSSKILSNEPLTKLLDLISCYDQGVNNSGKLEIISNCLRKIEVEHWDYLFTELHLTPRDLLLQCIEQDEARVLGVLLMVFLNYDGNKQNFLLSSNPKPKSRKNKKNKHRKSATKLQLNNASPISTVLNDEELMVQVLKILVNTAASSSEYQEAREFWDLSLQLIRFIHALDEGNQSSLVQRAVQLIA